MYALSAFLTGPLKLNVHQKVAGFVFQLPGTRADQCATQRGLRQFAYKLWMAFSGDLWFGRSLLAYLSALRELATFLSWQFGVDPEFGLYTPGTITTASRTGW